MEGTIRTVDVTKDSEGNYKNVQLVFGPHYFVEILQEQNKKVTFELFGVVPR
jgi:hypothetical protein